MRSEKFALALLLCLPPALTAGETSAVLSAGTGVYLEAFSSFQASFGSEVPYADLALGEPELPPGTRVVVAFGRKAASYPYPQGTNLVYCMAPGTFVRSAAREARTVKVSMLPGFDTIAAKIKAIQPGIKRLTLFWMLPDYGRYAEPMKKAGAAVGLKVTPVWIESFDALPAMLRREMRNMDAFWLLPDPLLVTQENLAVFREFSWGNNIPFYGSTKGMTQAGAVASVGVSFTEAGVAAAGAARRMEAGEALPEIIFPQKAEVTLNASAAKKCRLEFSRAVIEEAGYMFP